MKHVIEDFLSYLQADRGYSPRTLTTYRESLVALECYFKSLDEGLDWLTLDADVIRRWIAAEMQRGKNPRTVVKDLAAVRSCYKYLLRMECVTSDPVRLVRNPRQHASLPTFLKQREIDSLFDEVPFAADYAGQRDRLILLTFYHTGVRVSELVSLDTGSLTATDADCGELRVIGKRDKERIIPYGPELRHALDAYLALRGDVAPDGEPALYLNAKGRRISVAQVQALVRRYLSLVTTQKRRSPHVLRHTFATAMLNHGADLEAIKELLGHESIATTEVYTHTTFADLKQQYEQAHPRA